MRPYAAKTAPLRRPKTPTASGEQVCVRRMASSRLASTTLRLHNACRAWERPDFQPHGHSCCLPPADICSFLIHGSHR